MQWNLFHRRVAAIFVVAVMLIISSNTFIGTQKTTIPVSRMQQYHFCLLFEAPFPRSPYKYPHKLH